MKLSLQEISKTYSNGVKAIDQITLDITPGMLGLLGPNGAGKSSLMRTIITLQHPDSGNIFFNDQDIFLNKTDFRKLLGFLPQEFGVFPKESAVTLLNYFAILKGISSAKQRNIVVDRVLELTNLQDDRKKSVSSFSGGMRQRFGIAQLLLNEPKIIIVDEPTAGLDPAERTRFLNILRNIGSDNIVIFSTHIVEDVQELCKEIAIINKGRLISKIDPKTAVKNLNGTIWETEKTEEELSTTSTPFLKLSDRFNEDNILVSRIHADKRPSDDCDLASPKLEDFYFLMLNRP